MEAGKATEQFPLRVVEVVRCYKPFKTTPEGPISEKAG